MFKPLMSKIMTEAHAAAREDMIFDRSQTSTLFAHRSYSYYLGLQMRNGFANARAAITGFAPGFQAVGVNRWY